ncbi:hypothetical protein BDV25DRAFT_170535 [Aspergillus avenaceus]|uniref:CST complex subunit Stn1 N-terminal domain-containing protein n=1 Tax=Aspergillus avenaceus TaxID=36643 RepID=A0A5N6TGH4_ASPAV|nr:hypothetical protein BDV25DRAFT_170535 [Aspergillus avenaceus]
MATADNGDLVFYPAYCFRASPTHFTWVKMAAVDVHLLKRKVEFKDQSIFFYLNHPIRFVSVVGIIVARTEYPALTILTLDDSSGATVEVVVCKVSATTDEVKPVKGAKGGGAESLQAPYTTKHVAATNRTDLDITALVPGAVSQLKGTLSAFRGTMQIRLERASVIRDTNAEMRFLDQRGRFLVEVLSIPWSVTRKEMARLRQEADEEEEKLEDGREKMQKRQRRRTEREERDYKKIQKLWEQEEQIRAKEAVYCRDSGAKVMRDIKRKKAG